MKSICTPRTTNPQKTPQDFCKTNPLNIYWWRVKSHHTFTHCIYHNIDTYDDCHIQAFSLRTHRQSGDVNLVKNPWTFGEINPQSMDGNFTKKPRSLWMSTKDHMNFNEIDTHSNLDSNFMKKKPLKSNKINSHSIYVAPHKTLWALVKSICTPRTTNLQKTPQDFCKTNPLNVYRWWVISPHTFTHCIMGYNTAHNRIY